jgi:hypothetical protein
VQEFAFNFSAAVADLLYGFLHAPLRRTGLLRLVTDFINPDSLLCVCDLGFCVVCSFHLSFRSKTGWLNPKSGLAPG